MEYKSLREKISAEKKEREARYLAYSRLLQEAWRAGMMAATQYKPRPMLVTDEAGTILDRVDDGPCGFAWVNVPGNTSFGKWLKKNNLARDDYPKGLCIWISDHNQSYERKRVHANAMALYLSDNGIVCSARGRLD